MLKVLFFLFVGLWTPELLMFDLNIGFLIENQYLIQSSHVWNPKFWSEDEDFNV